MRTILLVVTYLHILFGALSILSAILALYQKKGSLKHIKSGNYFFKSMIGVFVSATLLAIFKERAFLFFVGFFSFYLALIGKLSMLMIRGHGNPSGFRAIHGVFIILHLALIFFGLSQSNGLFVLSIVFGLIGLLFSIQAYVDLNRDRPRIHWLRRHISGMIGGFIACISAFSVVTFEFIPGLLRWLWPTIILTPVIIYWQKKISKRNHQINSSGG